MMRKDTAVGSKAATAQFLRFEGLHLQFEAIMTRLQRYERSTHKCEVLRKHRRALVRIACNCRPAMSRIASEHKEWTRDCHVSISVLCSQRAVR